MLQENIFVHTIVAYAHIWSKALVSRRYCCWVRCKPLIIQSTLNWWAKVCFLMPLLLLNHRCVFWTKMCLSWHLKWRYGGQIPCYLFDITAVVCNPLLAHELVIATSVSLWWKVLGTNHRHIKGLTIMLLCPVTGKLLTVGSWHVGPVFIASHW